MTIDANALLRTLGANIAGSLGGTGQTAPTQTNTGLDFAKLLASARAGDIHSGIKVTTARDANVTMTDAQSQRLSAAADLAEANGISRGLFLIDGKSIVMDIGNRTIIGEVSPAHAGVVDGVDGVINVPAQGEQAPAGLTSPSGLVSPASGLSAINNTSLLEALNERGTRAA